MDQGCNLFSYLVVISSFLALEERLTLPETDIAPENRASQKETSIPTIHLQVLC